MSKLGLQLTINLRDESLCLSGGRRSGISDGNLARLIVATVSGVLATRFLEDEVDVRTVLADFGALIESPPAASPPVARPGAN